MTDVFSFYLEMFQDFFYLLAYCELWPGLNLLTFLIANIVLLIIVDNFIIKPAKGSSGHFKVSRKSSKGGK